MKFKAVIVESRKNKDLVDIIINKHLKYLPTKYELHVFVSENNRHLVEKIDFKRNSSITVLKKDIRSLDDYNSLLLDKSFWVNLNCEKVLIFQTDSELLREGIEEFEIYDWVGAPWPDSGWSQGEPWIHCSNGGLSFRDVRKMIEVLDRFPIKNLNEDGYFCLGLLQMGAKIAPRDVGMRFSVECIWGLGSLGIHAIDKWFSKDQILKIKNQYRINTVQERQNEYLR